MTNMFNSKNDPLVAAAAGALKEGELRRQAETYVNEMYGVYNRNAVIREDLKAYDADIQNVFQQLKEGNQLDEISKGKLADYVKGASISMAKKYADIPNKPLNKKERDAAQSNLNKYWNRRTGISTAVDKLTKEDRDSVSGEEYFKSRQARRDEKETYGAPKKYKEADRDVYGVVGTRDRLKAMIAARKKTVKEDRDTQSGEDAFKSRQARRDEKETYSEPNFKYKKPEKDVYGVIGSKAREKAMAAAAKRKNVKEESQLDELHKVLRRYADATSWDGEYITHDRDYARLARAKLSGKKTYKTDFDGERPVKVPANPLEPKQVGLRRSKKQMEEETQLDERERTNRYVTTVKHGDESSEKVMSAIKDAIRGYNKAKGADVRYDRAGRLGKNNPNASKYSKDGRGGKLNRTKIRQGDADHSDVYLRTKPDYDLPDGKRRENEKHVSRVLHGIKNKFRKQMEEETQLDELSSFGREFAAARSRGDSTFSWKGKSFNTQQKGETSSGWKGGMAQKALSNRNSTNVSKTSGIVPNVPTTNDGAKNYPDIGNVAKGPFKSTMQATATDTKSDFLNKGVNVAAKTDAAAKSAIPASMPPSERSSIPTPPTQATAVKAGLPPKRPTGLNEGVNVGGVRYKI